MNSIDPKQLTRIHQQRLHEQKRRELERYINKFSPFFFINIHVFRYIRALKTTLRERCSKRGINVPPLCSCHSTIWDADPMTCSQNCSFYQNPKGNHTFSYLFLIINFPFQLLQHHFIVYLHHVKRRIKNKRTYICFCLLLINSY